MATHHSGLKKSGAILAAACLVGAPLTAQAAEVAPGAPYRVPPVEASVPGAPAELDEEICSQGPNGIITHPDGTQERVMLTAGHCVRQLLPSMPAPSGEVFVEKLDGKHRIGEVTQSRIDFADPSTMPDDVAGQLVHGFTAQDWAIVNLDDGVMTTRIADSIDENGVPSGAPHELTGVRIYRDLPEGVPSLDNIGQPVCKEGQTTGHSCGIQLFRTQNAVFTFGQGMTNGDSGGVHYDPRTGEIVGVTSQRIGEFGRVQPADSILNNAYGIPDEQINEQFRMADSTEGHDQDFKPMAQTLEEKAAWFEANPDVADAYLEQMKKYQEELFGAPLPEDSELPDLPLPELPDLQLPEAPDLHLPEAPALPDLPLPELPELPVPGIASDAAVMFHRDVTWNLTPFSVDQLPELTGLPATPEVPEVPEVPAELAPSIATDAAVMFHRDATWNLTPFSVEPQLTEVEAPEDSEESF